MYLTQQITIDRFFTLVRDQTGSDTHENHADPVETQHRTGDPGVWWLHAHTKHPQIHAGHHEIDKSIQHYPIIYDLQLLIHKYSHEFVASR